MSELFITCVVSLFSLICILPILLVFTNSIASEKSIGTYGYSFFPKEISLSAYRAIFYPGSPILKSYAISVFITAAGTILALLITYLAAYALANRHVKYRNELALFFFITTVFNSGLVPWYLMCKLLHLYNNIWSLIIPSLVFSPFNLFLMRNFIRGLPDSLMESAKMDGAKETRIAFQIYFPLCLPAIATVSLFYALGYWNDWFNAVMLLDNANLYPLQMTLFKIQSDSKMLSEVTSIIAMNPPTESLKMATAIVTIGPIVLLYPFLQKYFVKGMIVGAIKG
ncbi:sugar ABC transporter permease [Gordoniibacillus kamchatkensis]|uniref:Sugar ABC transporter permease n=1 Tax=Gordoniibacillus kamchatkensis TaxID=1590651 RepID=A0ABR5AHV4_9BACL|nr:sugar ABC transporter permease [Paenibacillus sp. VKM B-2647]